MTTSRKSTVSPENVAMSCDHRARMTSTYSSVRRARSGNETPMTSNSSSSHPMPTPSTTRPPDRTSSVATSLARTTGLRWGRIRMPVPRRRVVVWAPTQVSQTSGSGMAKSSPPGIFPLRE